MSDDLIRVRRALVSVSDKTGLEELAKALHGHGIELISTGGTAAAIAGAGIPCVDVVDVTGFPEMMDGRLKTLHPRIHGGLLAVRDNREHRQAQADHEIRDIDLVVVNLYAFQNTVDSRGDFDACMEKIDIGGPAMIRAAAKNHRYVAVVTDTGDYGELLGELDTHGGRTTGTLRRAFAARALALTSAYDGAIADWLHDQAGIDTPRLRTLSGRLVQSLRYGENPHQRAAFYRTGKARSGVASAQQVQGRALSYNNINDTDAAFECVAEFDPGESAAIAIVKHANPCGVATGETLAAAHARALMCDPQSAFGGIVAANRMLDGEAARAITGVFTEVIIAPGASEEALAIVEEKKNIRLLLTRDLPGPQAGGMTFRSVAGGFLMQTRDSGRVRADQLKTVTRRKPSARERRDLLFALRVCKHVKSNAIVYARDGATVGIGAGQMSRIDAARIAAAKSADAARAAGAGEPLTKGSVVASDAFFPFADGVLAAAEAGATAVIQPGGSRRDEEVIAAADEAGLAMLLTGVRHFRH